MSPVYPPTHTHTHTHPHTHTLNVDSQVADTLRAGVEDSQVSADDTATLLVVPGLGVLEADCGGVGVCVCVLIYIYVCDFVFG
jgi:hypothetical protein